MSNSLPCFTAKGWAKVNVAYPDVYVVENIVVVKYGSTSEFTSLDSIDYFAQYMTRKTQNQMKGIGRTLKHKQKREKQQKECKVIGCQFQSRWRSITKYA